MHRLYKPSILVLLVGLLSLPGLLCVYYEWAQFQAREEMEEKLEHEQLQHLQLSEASIIWYKPGKEILINGKLFDVKKMDVENGTAFISGLYDDQETVIKDQLQSLQKKQDKNQHSGKIAFKWVHQTLYISSFDFSWNRIPPLHTNTSPFRDKYFPQIFAEILLPPPKCNVLNS